MSGEWSNLNVNGDSVWRLSVASVLVWKGNQITSCSEKGQIRQKPGAEISTGIYSTLNITSPCSLLFRMITFDICNPCANKCAVVTFLNGIVHVLILHYTSCTGFNGEWLRLYQHVTFGGRKMFFPLFYNTQYHLFYQIGNLYTHHLIIALPSEISLSFDDHVHNYYHIPPRCHSKSCFILL